MGQQQTKVKAICVLRRAFEQAEPPLTAEQKDAIARYFDSEM